MCRSLFFLSLTPQFIEILKKYSFDMQQFFKKIADTSIYICLVSKPEQESALLSMLVEKLGDPDVTVPF